MQRTLQRGLKVPEAAAGTAVSGAVALRFQVVGSVVDGGMEPWPPRGTGPRQWLGWIMLIAAVSVAETLPKLGPDFNTAPVVFSDLATGCKWIPSDLGPAQCWRLGLALQRWMQSWQQCGGNQPDWA